MIHTMDARGFDAPPQAVDLTALKLPVYLSRLVIIPGAWEMSLCRPPPSRWVQFWQRVLLGWTWLKVVPE